MTITQIEQVKSQLPQGETIDRTYNAFEGGIRIITKDNVGRETRYNLNFDANGDASIEKF